MVKAVQVLGMPLTEFIDLLNEFGITANIDYEDYLQDLKNLEEIW